MPFLTGFFFLVPMNVLMITGIGRICRVRKRDGSRDDPEHIFIELSNLLFNPWVAGFMTAAIMAAIMSTVDSFLLVTSTALAEDFCKRLFRKNASEKE